MRYENTSSVLSNTSYTAVHLSLWHLQNLPLVYRLQSVALSCVLTILA